MIFPIFTSLAYYSFPTFNQLTSLKNRQTVPTGLPEQEQLIWAASNPI
jgi:hypothetical protein